MFFVGIDLAERHSAAVILTEHDVVLYESFIDAGAQEKPPNPFKNLRAITDWWIEILEYLVRVGANPAETVFAVESPYHHARNAGPALLVQGGLLALMVASDIEAHLITPLTWQQHFGYSKKEHKDSKKWAEKFCADLGYVPGHTFPEGTKVLAKPRTDLRDAYLIARWLCAQVFCR